MAALGGYLTAKFLWNPDYDENTAMNEFLDGYYGKAAGPIRKYLDLLHDHVEKKNIHVMIWAPPTQPPPDRRPAGPGRRALAGGGEAGGRRARRAAAREARPDERRLCHR